MTTAREVIVVGERLGRQVETTLAENPQLAESSLKVRLSSKGPEGLAIYRAHRPALLVTELVAPGVDGLQLIHAVRMEEGDRETPVIVSASLGRGDQILEQLRVKSCTTGSSRTGSRRGRR